MKGVSINTPFAIKTYQECMECYGTDKPDLRFGMEMNELTAELQNVDLGFIQDALLSGAIVKGFVVEDNFSRKLLAQYEEFLKTLGIKGLCWLKKQGGQFKSNIIKFLKEQHLTAIEKKFSIEDNCTLLFCVGSAKPLNNALDQLRRKIATDLNLISDNYSFLWVVDFPLFEINEEGQKVSVHHPFTMYDSLTEKDLFPTSLSYDLVLNGYEIGGGSRRIHDADIQRAVFEKLAMNESEIKDHFEFFIEALEYGAPPHLGIALGVERLLMILCDTDSMRDVLAFPKTLAGNDLMTKAPFHLQ